MTHDHLHIAMFPSVIIFLKKELERNNYIGIVIFPFRICFTLHYFTSDFLGATNTDVVSFARWQHVTEQRWRCSLYVHLK